MAPGQGYVTGTMMADLGDVRGFGGGGTDDPRVPFVVALIFPQIAAMKAGHPISRKIRAMPAWISPRCGGQERARGRALPSSARARARPSRESSDTI